MIQEYPPYVTTEQERQRWDYAKGIAEQTFGDMGKEMVWGATRAIYDSDIPTDT